MQAGDLEKQSTEDTELLTREPVVAHAETILQPPIDSAHIENNGSLWQRLRKQRREIAAAVALIVLAIIWFDSGNSRQDSNTVSLDPLDGYEAVLSDFTVVGDDGPVRESADPFDSASQNSFSSGLTIPQSPESAASSTASSYNPPAGYAGAASAANASYPENARAFNASATGPAAVNGSDPQQRRRVRFAGRIQPAH